MGRPDRKLADETEPYGLLWDILAFVALSGLVAVLTFTILALEPSTPVSVDGGGCSATRK